MKNKISILEENSIRSKIHVIRGQQVMLDFDLAAIYGYETKNFNRQVKNNIERFDSDFMFQLSDAEMKEILRCKNFTSNWGGTRYNPYAFTEQGIYMLMTVLKGDLAVTQSKMLIRTFKEMKHFIQNNSHIFVELDNIKKHLVISDIHQTETDKKIDELFSLMDKYNVKETQGIFFQGQIFDAYAKFESFLSAAKKEIILIDNYVDLSILQRLAKKKKGVNVIIYTDPKTKLTAQDVQTFNGQYPTLTLNYTTKTHDRFLIIDNSTIYHIGASLKDLGKKCFCFDLLDSGYIPMILKNL
ncbi:ORF6N domain-containing protein [Treponema sp.]|uniref:ORF6N domain-containing protein n=1 Tax=Treponema sp. TaxID=166 RepID=UPI00298DBF75|nr:ORF6N domain-containing protein [Treponema sp.]MCR5613291.1 ORF6N domain-containing protein [Treponema sp.]